MTPYETQYLTTFGYSQVHCIVIDSKYLKVTHIPGHYQNNVYNEK